MKGNSKQFNAIPESKREQSSASRVPHLRRLEELYSNSNIKLPFFERRVILYLKGNTDYSFNRREFCKFCYWCLSSHPLPARAFRRLAIFAVLYNGELSASEIRNAIPFSVRTIYRNLPAIRGKRKTKTEKDYITQNYYHYFITKEVGHKCMYGLTKEGKKVAKDLWDIAVCFVEDDKIRSYLLGESKLIERRRKEIFEAVFEGGDGQQDLLMANFPEFARYIDSKTNSRLYLNRFQMGKKTPPKKPEDRGERTHEALKKLKK